MNNLTARLIYVVMERTHWSPDDIKNMPVGDIEDLMTLLSLKDLNRKESSEPGN